MLDAADAAAACPATQRPRRPTTTARERRRRRPWSPRCASRSSRSRPSARQRRDALDHRGSRGDRVELPLARAARALAACASGSAVTLVERGLDVVRGHRRQRRRRAARRCRARGTAPPAPAGRRRRDGRSPARRRRSPRAPSASPAWVTNASASRSSAHWSTTARHHTLALGQGDQASSAAPPRRSARARLESAAPLGDGRQRRQRLARPSSATRSCPSRRRSRRAVARAGDAGRRLARAAARAPERDRLERRPVRLGEEGRGLAVHVEVGAQVVVGERRRVLPAMALAQALGGLQARRREGPRVGRDQSRDHPPGGMLWPRDQADVGTPSAALTTGRSPRSESPSTTSGPNAAMPRRRGSSACAAVHVHLAARPGAATASTASIGNRRVDVHERGAGGRTSAAQRRVPVEADLGARASERLDDRAHGPEVVGLGRSRRRRPSSRLQLLHERRPSARGGARTTPGRPMARGRGAGSARSGGGARRGSAAGPVVAPRATSASRASGSSRSAARQCSAGSCARTTRWRRDATHGGPANARPVLDQRVVVGDAAVLDRDPRQAPSAPPSRPRGASSAAPRRTWPSHEHPPPPRPTRARASWRRRARTSRRRPPAARPRRRGSPPSRRDGGAGLDRRSARGAISPRGRGSRGTASRTSRPTARPAGGTPPGTGRGTPLRHPSRRPCAPRCRSPQQRLQRGPVGLVVAARGEPPTRARASPAAQPRARTSPGRACESTSRGPRWSTNSMPW